MSGNHYSKQVAQLEALLASKLKQVSLLSAEHQLLRNKETALHNAIHSIEGPLALVRASLGELSAAAPAVKQEPGGGMDSTPPPAMPAAAATAAAADADRISWGSSGSHSLGVEQCSPCTSADAAAVERSGHSITSSASGLAARPYRDGQEVLQRINRQEVRVQRVMQAVGCCDSASYQQLYTTQLLQKATADPVRMAGYLNMPKPERLRYWSEAYSKMALLLGKYDSNVSLASTGNVRQQLDFLVDELFERVTVCALLDPPPKHMSCFMINVDTQEFEPYPDKWWAQVAEGMELSSQDKATLQLVWSKIKVAMQQLAQEWEQLQQQLQQLHTLQLQSNKRFEHDIKQLPGLLHTLTVAEQSRLLHKQHQQHQPHQQVPCSGQHAPQSSSLQAEQLNIMQPQPAALGPLQQQMQQLQQQEAHVLQQQQQQLASLQQQQLVLQQQREQRAALSALHTSWQEEGVSINKGPSAAGMGDQQALSPQEAEALADELCAQLAAELQQEQALQQQVQALQQQQAAGWGAPLPIWPAAAAAPAAAVPAALHVLPAILPAAAAGPASSRLPSSLSPVGDGGPAAAAAAVAAGRAPSPQLSGGREGMDSHDGLLSGGREGMDGHDLDSSSGCFAVHAAPGGFTKLEEAEEVLLQDGSAQRQQLEARMQSCTNRMKVLNYCLNLQVTNCLSRKQLAAMCVHSHPFVFDVMGICEALDEMGWDS